MPSTRRPARPALNDPAIRALAALRRHSRECRSIETRQYLVAVERRMVQLIDLGLHTPAERCAPCSLAAE